jgi:4-hydroxy 2-oxovalerate aldolase
MATKLLDHENDSIKLIASSNLSKSSRGFDYVINYSDVIDEEAEFPDNSMCMLLRTLIRCECKKVSLAGLDGYTADCVNFFDADKEYSFLKEKADSLNEYARMFLASISDKMVVRFVTKSKYQEG